MHEDTPEEIHRDDDEDRTEQPAHDEAEARQWHQLNRAAWNEGAAYYTGLIERDSARLRAGGSSIHPLERANLGDLGTWCDTAIHLQCASGCDTLSLLNEGARYVVGIDISDDHIENARRMAALLNANATFYRCDVLDVPSELDGTADLVYTGRGALCWVHAIDRWAEVVARLLKPGGIVHILEDHPVTWLFDPEGDELVYTPRDYFTHTESSKGWPAVYIGDLSIPEHQQTRKYERAWPVSTIFAALRRAGLTVEHFGEHNDQYWKLFPDLKPEIRQRLPFTYTLIARRPAER